MTEQKHNPVRILVLELALLATALVLMWTQPFGEPLSPILAGAVTILFLAILPVVLRANRAAELNKAEVHQKTGTADDAGKNARANAAAAGE